MAADLAAYEWRAGRKVGRTIYAMRGYDRDADVLIGVMDTPALAANAVAAHNARLELGQDVEDVEPVFGEQTGPAPG